MALIKVKLFGVFRTDSGVASETINVDKIINIFDSLNDIIDANYKKNLELNPQLIKSDPIKFKDAVVYINGERCSNKNKRLNENDEVWIMSPASGG